MAYEKMHNIFDLAIRMQSSAEGISIADVMQQFDVSRRTAERMRNFIRERFPQLTETIGEHGVKRWHLPYGALKNYISFSAEEISTLQNALRLLKHVQLCEQSRTLAGLPQNPSVLGRNEHSQKMADVMSVRLHLRPQTSPYRLFGKKTGVSLRLSERHH